MAPTDNNTNPLYVPCSLYVGLGTENNCLLIYFFSSFNFYSVLLLFPILQSCERQIVNVNLLLYMKMKEFSSSCIHFICYGSFLFCRLQ